MFLSFFNSIERVAFSLALLASIGIMLCYAFTLRKRQDQIKELSGKILVIENRVARMQIDSAKNANLLRDLKLSYYEQQEASKRRVDSTLKVMAKLPVSDQRSAVLRILSEDGLLR